MGHTKLRNIHLQPYKMWWILGQIKGKQEKETRETTYNVKLRRVRVTIFAVEKQ
jgi:hypothetical protein